MVKQVFFYIIAFVLTVGFVRADVSENNKKRAAKSADCPYLKSIMNSSNSMECPFMSGKSKVKNECPYVEKKKSGKCPYNDEIREGNLKSKRKNTAEIELRSS